MEWTLFKDVTFSAEEARAFSWRSQGAGVRAEVRLSSIEGDPETAASALRQGPRRGAGHDATGRYRDLAHHRTRRTFRRASRCLPRSKERQDRRPGSRPRLSRCIATTSTLFDATTQLSTERSSSPSSGKSDDCPRRSWTRCTCRCLSGWRGDLPSSLPAILPTPRPHRHPPDARRSRRPVGTTRPTVNQLLGQLRRPAPGGFRPWPGRHHRLARPTSSGWLTPRSRSRELRCRAQHRSTALLQGAVTPSDARTVVSASWPRKCRPLPPKDVSGT